ncbi:pyridoxamine 5'-phosphate oxidase family protein [Pacificibacter marinus]|uniref:pyridoxamine 5'-phosphate oxidase family protein n=1 Tax=Pacificibacter marinus TaxID=658057 RepID=UPI001C06A44B|nr:pyridoxamine 5'-phosphate oxidase family protein [Pacificibacter marinus]MBU2866889.1 pyridoxamine 5'-phosphate oxidase family protein [Pacificibacter marinus]
MNAPHPADLAQFSTIAWSALVPQIVADKRKAQVATLSTVGQGGAPAARSVVLRASDRSRASVDIFTDAATPKCAEITNDPRAALTLWREDLQLQLRLSGTIEIVEGLEAQAAWSALPDLALPNYGVTPPPGSDIPTATSYARQPDQARFAILRMTLFDMDVVSLAAPVHTRAYYERRDGWRGVWRAP